MKAAAELYFQRHSTQILINTAKVFGIGLVVGLTYSVYQILCLIFSSLISLLIIAFLLRKLILLVCRVLTFPGSTWYWRRNVESYFQKNYVVKIRKRVLTLRTLMEYLLEERAWSSFYYNDEELYQAKKTIISTLSIFRKQASHKTLNQKQKEFMNAFADLEQLLNDIKIVNKADGKSVTIWNFLSGSDRKFSNKDQAKTILHFEDKNQGYILLNACTGLEERLNDIICKKRWYLNLKRWAYEESFGTLDQLREELDTRYKCRPVSLKPEKNINLDCMLVYGKVSSRDDPDHGSARGANHLDQDSKRDKLSEGTIIFCCPNAGYYEYMFYENEWVELYLRNGLNVFLWNYRGFGRSTGTPHPNALRRDGEAIVDYLRKELKMKKIGVHGESLGGLVTTHLGRAKDVNYICADRTFASLSRVAEVSFGAILAKIFRIFTLWDDQIYRDFLQTRCYKIITFDPKDEIIHMLSSLKYGVTSRIVQQQLGYNEKIPYPNLKEDQAFFLLQGLTFLKKTGRAINNEFKKAKMEKELDGLNEFLTKDQTLALFCAFNRISELFITLSSLNALNMRRKTKHSHHAQKRPKLSKPVQPGKVGLDTKTTSDPEVEDNKQILLKGQISIGGEENISFANDTRMLNESIDPKISRLDDSDLIESINKKSYSDAFNEEAQNSEKVIELLVKIYAIFEDLEAGGVFLSDVMSLKESLRYPAFQHFIHSLKIWGSYYPLLKVVEEGAKDLSFYQNNAQAKLKEFINKTDKILQKQKLQQSRAQNKLIAHVLDDLELIGSIMPCLYQALAVKSSKSSMFTSVNSASSRNTSKQEEIELVLGDPKEAQTRLRTSGVYSDSEAGVPADECNVGHLIPLACGHNGSPRPHEIQLFEYLFQNANMLG